MGHISGPQSEARVPECVQWAIFDASDFARLRMRLLERRLLDVAALGRAGKTHREVEVARRTSSRALTRLVKGIERRALSVFPKGMCIAPSRICSHSRR